MIQDIAWYIESGRFSGIATGIETAVRDYHNALLAGTEDEQRIARENARTLCESHAYQSGLVPCHRFINIDVEFFNGKNLDETAVDSFIKEILKAHGYQRILWTYMGTTGSMTVISKNAMETEGMNPDSYLPVRYKKPQSKKSPIALEENTVPFYVYSDGSIRQTYDKQKAQISFDALKDSSGFNWNKGYDPNDTIKKDSWFGAFDHEGVWTRVEKNNSEASVDPLDQSIPTISIIRNGNNAILRDPGNLLLQPAEILWLTEGGAEYGTLETSPEQTLIKISKTLQDMGLQSVSGISCAIHTDEKETIRAYKEKLGMLADTSLHLMPVTELNRIEKKEKHEQETRAKEDSLLSLDKRAALLISRGITGTELITSLQTNTLRVPLSIYKRKDALSLGVSDMEYTAITQLKVPYEKIKQFDSALTNIFSAWDIYKSAGLTREEIAVLILDTLTASIASDKTLTVETTFKELVTGDYLAIPGTFSETQQTVSETDIEEVTRELPPTTDTQSKKNVNAIKRVLENWKYIAESTGMTKPEALAEAIKLVGGNPGIVAIQKSGYINPSSRVPLADKRIFFELPLTSVCSQASVKTLKDREISIQEIEATQPDLPELLIIGGTRGTPVTLEGIDADFFFRSGHFSKTEADEAERLLHSWHLSEHAEPGAHLVLKSLIIDAIKPPKGRWTTAQEFHERVLSHIDSRQDVRYNLHSPEGLQQAQHSTRYRATDLQEELLESCILTQTRATLKPNTKSIASITIEPVLFTKPNPTPLIKKNPRGIPEKAYPLTRPQPVITQPTPNEPDTRATIFTQTGTVLSTTLLYDGQTDLPCIIFGADPTTSFLTLAEYPELSKTKLIHSGYTPSEATRTTEILKEICITPGKEAHTTQHILPEILRISQQTKTAAEFETILLHTLEQRTDTAFNLSSTTGKKSWTETTQYLLSGLDETQLEGYIHNATTPLYARNNSTHTPNHIELPNADTILSAELNTAHTQPILFIGGHEGQPLWDISHIDLTQLTKTGYTKKDAQHIMALLDSYRIHSTATANETELPALIRALIATKTAPQKIRIQLETAFAARTDVAYDLTTPQGRTAYTATEHFKRSGLNQTQLQHILSTLTHKQNTTGPNRSSSTFTDAAGTSLAQNVPTINDSTGAPTVHSNQTYTDAASAQLVQNVPTQRDITGTSTIHSSGNPASPNALIPALTRPIYATRIPPALQKNTAPHTTSIPGSPKAQSTTPVTTSSPRGSLSEFSRGPNDLLPQVLHTTTGTSGTNLPERHVDTPGTLRCASPQAEHTHLKHSPQPATVAKPSLTTKHATPETPEQQRMKRIQANYEHDKATLDREKQPALTRKNTHDVGHAEGTGDGELDRREIKKLSDSLERDIKEQLAKKA